MALHLGRALASYFWVGVLLVLAACSGSTVGEENAEDRVLPEPTEAPQPAEERSAPTSTAAQINPTPTPIATEPPTPTATPIPTPTATAIPTPTPVPTPDALTLTGRAIATAGSMIPNSSSASFDYSEAGEEFIEVCPGVPRFGTEIARSLRTTAAGSAEGERFQSVVVFLFRDNEQAQLAQRNHFDAIRTCVDPDGSRFERDGDFFLRGTTASGITNTYAIRAVGQLVIRVITEAPDGDGYDAALLLSAAATGRTLEVLQPGIDPLLVQSQLSVSTASNVTVTDGTGAALAVYDRAVFNSDDDAFGDPECAAPVSGFDDYWFRDTDGEFQLVCGIGLPIQAIDPASGAASESHSFFIADSCPEDLYAIETLDVPLIVTDVPPQDELTVSTDEATVVAYQCVRK